MDFSWVKDLADEANRVEKDRRDKQRRECERDKQLALATAPFVEKLHLVVSTCAEEFNKYVNYSRGKVLASRIQKRIRRTVNENDQELSYPEEATFFTFNRKDWTFGVRGCAGLVEFIEIPTTGESMSARLDELGATPSRKLEAYLDEATQRVGWKESGKVVDGQEIMTICKNYFKDFIEKTN
jgi:hypothetical protein